MINLKKIILLILIVCLVFLPSSSNSYAITDYKIMNEPTATKQQIKTWAKEKGASDLYIELIDMAYDIAVKYEIDPTVMLAQTAIETGYFRFGGVIDESYHNTAGIKITKGGGNYDANAHYKFDSWEEGFEAQAQHLRLYAGYCHHYREDCPHECPKIIDPRHFKEIGGRATHASELTGVWASDANYGDKINGLCNEIVETKVTEEVNTKTIKDETKKISVVEKIKTYMSNDSGNKKINYIKNLLFNKENKDSFKKQIKEKIK